MHLALLEVSLEGPVAPAEDARLAVADVARLVVDPADPHADVKAQTEVANL